MQFASRALMKTIPLKFVVMLCASLSGGGALGQSLDITFNPGTGPNATILAIAFQADGKMVLGSQFTSFNGVPRNHIARLDANGGLDFSYDPMEGPYAGYVTGVAPQPDGKVIIGGLFTEYNSIPRRYFTRTRADGSLDLSYRIVDVNGPIFSFLVQGDGRIVIIGSFSQVNGTNRNGIARMNPDGSLDLSFNSGSGPNTSFDKLVMISGGRFLISGGFTSYNGTNRSYLARLDSNGGLDTSFQLPFLGGSSIHSMAEQPDGKIIISGAFQSIDGYSRNRIARVNSDGSLDFDFYHPAGISYPAETITVQSDGKIVISGGFQYVDGVWHPIMAKLNPNGTLDPAYNPQFNLNSGIALHIPQALGKFLVTGSFSQINGTNINQIARLNGDSFLPPESSLLSAKLYMGITITGTVSNEYRIEYVNNLTNAGMWMPLTNITLPSSPYLFFDTISTNLRQRFYRALTLP
jgi:uncharacterized delta-60 repeat protein